MKPFFYFLILSLLCCCGKEKTIQLPEINYSQISDIHDVSAAYLFYDETKPDNVELNRNNLIGTTNWLVNVDKRLKLGQAIPKIMFLQDKKRSSELHKNDLAKNYYSCNNVKNHRLGFIGFTHVVYHTQAADKYLDQLDTGQVITIVAQAEDNLRVSFISQGTTLSHSSNYRDLPTHLKTNLTNTGQAIIVLQFSANLRFQEYITLKDLLSKINISNATIAHDEFVFN